MRSLRAIVFMCAASLAFALLIANPAVAAAPQPSGNLVPSTTGSLNAALERSQLLEAAAEPTEKLIRVAKNKKWRKRHKKRKKWRKIRRAIGAAIVTGVVVNELSRASRGRSYGRGQCRRWFRSCNRGYEEACRTYYRNCE